MIVAQTGDECHGEQIDYKVGRLGGVLIHRANSHDGVAFQHHSMTAQWTTPRPVENPFRLQNETHAYLFSVVTVDL